MSYSLETVKQIWNDKTGERIDITSDADALDLVEIREISKEGKIEARITMEKEAAVLLIQALKEYLGE